MPTASSSLSTGRGSTKTAVDGRVTGALFFICFGAVWVYLGLREAHRASTHITVLLAGVVLCLLATAAWLFVQARGLPAGTLLPEQEARMKRMFTAVNIIQWVSIVTAVAILSVLHHPAYIVPAISIIVGLHLLPLAQSFHYAQHYVTGLLLLVWAAGCMALLSQDAVSGICSTGTGVILLGSALSTLLRCSFDVRRTAPRSPLAATTT